LATILQYLRIPVVPYNKLTGRTDFNAVQMDESLTYFCQGFPIEGR